MTDRLIFFLLGLTGRERWLLAAVPLLVLPLALWIGLLQPLISRRDAARTELADAVILRQWVVDSAESARRLGQSRRGGASEPISIAGLENTLVAANLRQTVSELSRRGGDAIDLRFDDVPFVELGTWLGDVWLGWGYDLTLFRIEPGSEPGLVLASFSLDPRR